MPPESNPAVSIVIPVYNEEKMIVATIDHLHQILQSSNYQYEIIVINDGSTDSTAQVLAAVNDIYLVEHNRNRGYGAALKTGIRLARYPFIVITDADGTYPNERIPDLLSLASRADMVVGARIGQNVTYS
ncbi:MAG: glycosyltransferase family 2 protein, partial [Waterburya sp.]